MIIALAGVALTGLVSALLVIGFGRPALLPAIAFGLLATSIQVVADRLLARRLGGPAGAFGRSAVAGAGRSTGNGCATGTGRSCAAGPATRGEAADSSP